MLQLRNISQRGLTLTGERFSAVYKDVKRYFLIEKLFHFLWYFQALTFKSSLICLYPLLYTALEIADPASLGLLVKTFNNKKCSL